MNDMSVPGPSLMNEACRYIQDRLSQSLLNPQVAIICGSGLHCLSELAQSPTVEIEYKDIPHFPASTVEGHIGKLRFGLINGDAKPIAIMLGRVHFYEGYSIQEITFPIRVLKLLGITTLIVTNAAGGLSDEFEIGDLVMLHDHINFVGLAGTHPLRGPNLSEFGVRFPAMSDAYDLRLRRKACRAWRCQQENRISPRKLHEGIYAFVSGPSYETRAEARLLRTLGADVVGMSSVPEIVVARHCAMSVFGLSLVTNKVVSSKAPSASDEHIQSLNWKSLKQIEDNGKADHVEVLRATQEAAHDIKQLIQSVLIDLVKSEVDGDAP